MNRSEHLNEFLRGFTSAVPGRSSLELDFQLSTRRSVIAGSLEGICHS
jgi:hypothetical protein